MLCPPSYRKSRSRIVRYCAYSCLQGFFDDFCISTLRMNDISVCDIPCNLAPRLNTLAVVIRTIFIYQSVCIE